VNRITSHFALFLPEIVLLPYLKTILGCTGGYVKSRYDDFRLPLLCFKITPSRCSNSYATINNLTLITITIKIENNYSVKKLKKNQFFDIYCLITMDKQTTGIEL
jgi:hypothetical protein